jgi:preprotein translocase subunit SecE
LLCDIPPYYILHLPTKSVIILDKVPQGSFFVKPISYIKGTLSELKQVTWPTRAQTIRLTITVILLSLVVGTYVGLLDIGFTNLLKFILG